MLPQFVLRVRRAVRRFRRGSADFDLTGAENRARWAAMLSEMEARDRAAERRLADAERALNRLNLS